jgi:hypothetical protein
MMIGQILRTALRIGASLLVTEDFEVPEGTQELHIGLCLEGAGNALSNAVVGRIVVNDGTVNVAQNTATLLAQTGTGLASNFASINSTITTAITHLRWTYQANGVTDNEFVLIVQFFGDRLGARGH